MHNPVRLAGGWVLVTLLSSAAYAEDMLTLAEAQRIAETRAPQIIATQAQEQASREMAVAANQLPDPVLKVGVNNVPISGESGWSVVQEGMTMRSVSVMQEFTRSDKREARALRATREADLAVATLRRTLADIRRETALGWFDVAFQEKLRALVQAQIDELGLQQQAADAAFRAGRGEQADVFANRLAIERARDQLDQMRRDIAMARERLARWIGRDAQRPPAALPDTTALSWQPARLEQEAAAHPALAVSRQQVAVAEAQAQIARANRRADVAVELMYSQRGPSYPNMVSLNVSMPLTWDRGHRQDRDLAASYAQLDEARAQDEDARRAYLASVRETLAAWQADRERLRRYDESLAPAAGQQLEAALAAYRAGTGGLSRVLEARRMALDVRMERERLALETARAWAQLDYLNPVTNQNPAQQGDRP